MNLNDEINFTPLWQWPLVLMAPAMGSSLASIVNPESVYLKLLYGSLSLFLMWAGPALFQKLFRFFANVWDGKGMIRRDQDSGAKQTARIYLNRERPSLLLAPLSFLFLKWSFEVGEIDINTGSTSVGNSFVSNLVVEEKQCRPIGTNDCITGAAAMHLIKLEAYIRNIPVKQVTDKEKKCLQTIIGLRESGLKIIEDVPQ